MRNCLPPPYLVIVIYLLAPRLKWSHRWPVTPGLGSWLPQTSDDGEHEGDCFDTEASDTWGSSFSGPGSGDPRCSRRGCGCQASDLQSLLWNTFISDISWPDQVMQFHPGAARKRQNNWRPSCRYTEDSRIAGHWGWVQNFAELSYCFLLWAQAIGMSLKLECFNSVGSEEIHYRMFVTQKK